MEKEKWRKGGVTLTDLLNTLPSNISELMNAWHTANLINLIQENNTYNTYATVSIHKILLQMSDNQTLDDRGLLISILSNNCLYIYNIGKCHIYIYIISKTIVKTIKWMYKHGFLDWLLLSVTLLCLLHIVVGVLQQFGNDWFDVFSHIACLG